MQVEIIYEDENTLVVNKPAGMIVNDSATAGGQNTLQAWLRSDKGIVTVERNGIVHRLDKDTSGILLAAKNEATMQFLQAQFKERQVDKTYLALVHGKLQVRSSEIVAPIARHPFNRQRFGVSIGGKEAATAYSVREVYQKDKSDFYSLIEVMPKTGRTHQIRVHFKHINHPLVADIWYTGRKTAKKDLKWCPRLFLHAYKLAIKLPGKSQKTEFEAALPTDLLQALMQLKKVDINA